MTPGLLTISPTPPARSLQEYLVSGRDGYDVFAECPVLVDEEQGPRLPNVVRNHFTLLSAVNGFRTPGSSTEKAIARFKSAIGKVRRVHPRPSTGGGSAADGIGVRCSFRRVAVAASGQLQAKGVRRGPHSRGGVGAGPGGGRRIVRAMPVSGSACALSRPICNACRVGVCCRHLRGF